MTDGERADRAKLRMTGQGSFDFPQQVCPHAGDRTSHVVGKMLIEARVTDVTGSTAPLLE